MGLISGSLSLWVLAGLMAFSVGVTLLTNWMMTGFRRPALPGGSWSVTIASSIASLVWIVLLFGAGVVAVRYIERIPNALLGYLAFGTLALLLSLVRAYLYRRISAEQVSRLMRGVVHNLTYLLLATILYLGLSLVLRRPAEPLLLLPLYVGALLPDLDSGDSILGRLLPFISRPLEHYLGHLGVWHSLAANVLVALIAAPFIVFIGVPACFLISLGFLSHILVDLSTPQGLVLFWPLTDRRYNLMGGPVAPQSAAERKLILALAVVAGILLLVVRIVPAPAPQVDASSYEQTLERYYSMRGKNLVFAWVDGSWQATGRRMSGHFEVLNAAGQSYVMLDRYSGAIFSAGRDASDNLYVNSISVSPGASVEIKPVEVHLQGQALEEALPVLYRMQREPGLQYIYVSGDIVVPPVEEVISPTLKADYAQTHLRRVQAHDLGHYTVRYLTAGELIELANLYVETADLVLVATYALPFCGPTVTPLPSPPIAPDDAK